MTEIETFSTAKEVDTYVQHILGNIQDEKERDLCGYDVANKYYEVGEYDTAHQYIKKYLNVCEESSEGQELLMKIQEKLEEGQVDQHNSSNIDANQSPLLQKGTKYRFSWVNGSPRDRDDSFEERDELYFKPVVSLPDLVEVKTGEEDEEKLFSERAKLYRWDADTKEWKERGIGQMKILYHPVNNTYRLLLRREQVHKIVCNLLITTSFQLTPFSNSDCEFLWAALNFAEDIDPEIEKLAVRFRSSDVAQEFKKKVEECVFELQKNASFKSDADNSEAHSSDDEQDDKEENVTPESSRNDDAKSYECKAMLIVKRPDAENSEELGDCELKMYREADTRMIRITAKKLDSEDVLCDTSIVDKSLSVKKENTVKLLFRCEKTKCDYSAVFQPDKDTEALKVVDQIVLECFKGMSLESKEPVEEEQ